MLDKKKSKILAYDLKCGIQTGDFRQKHVKLSHEFPSAIVS